MANIYRYKASGSFQQVSGQLKTIAVGDENNVWGLNDAGKIYRFNVSTGKFEQKAAGQTLKRIAVGSSVWGIDFSGKPHRWNGSKFVKVSGYTSYIGVPQSDGHPWARYGNGIFRYNPKADAFEGIPNTNFKFLGVGNDDAQVWVLDNSGWPWMWNGKQFVQGSTESLRLNFVAAGLSNIFGISLSERTYRTAALTGYVLSYFEEGLIPGRLVYIDTGYLRVSGKLGAGEKETVWGLNSAGKAYQLQTTWKQRGGPFSVLSVGIGTLEEGLADDAKTPVWYEEPNVWAIG